MTWATTLSPLANGASRIFWGWASDRLGRETTMVLTSNAGGILQNSEDAKEARRAFMEKRKGKFNGI